VFGFLKRKKHTYPSESRWAVLEGKHDGKVMYVRRNASAAQLSGHVEYKYRVGVAVPLNNPNEYGLPGSEENEQLNAIEDDLVSRLEAEQRSLQVLAITTGGMREFIFYTRDHLFSQAAFESLRDEVTSHELQAYIKEDPAWVAYDQFA